MSLFAELLALLNITGVSYVNPDYDHTKYHKAEYKEVASVYPDHKGDYKAEYNEVAYAYPANAHQSDYMKDHKKITYVSPLYGHETKLHSNIVSYYDDGYHTVIQPDGKIEYWQPGKDLVHREGDDFHQYYKNPDGKTVHTLFKNVGHDTSCQNGWLFLENPYDPPNGETWGYYFPEGDNYCVMSDHQKRPGQ